VLRFPLVSCSVFLVSNRSEGKQDTMTDISKYEAMTGTVQVERRKLGRDQFIELKFRVDKVRFHRGRNGKSVTISGRCIEHPEGQPGPTYANSTWYGAYCSQIVYLND
jgi:hypothetical protein